MADVRESFTTLEGASEEGLALRAIQIGQAVASKNGSLAITASDSTGNGIAVPVRTEGQDISEAVPVLGFKDPSGDLAYGKVNAAGELIVSIDGVGNGLNARGTATGSLTTVTVASLTLANSKTYDKLDYIVSCFRDSLFQVILSDNAVETIISEALCGPGQFSFHGALKEAEIVSGATGTQLLLIKAKNFNATSDFRASLSVNEI